jgi:hypothetical protein
VAKCKWQIAEIFVVIKDKEQNRKLQSIIELLALAYNFDTIKENIIL